MMRHQTIHDRRLILAFAEKAAEHFAENPEHSSYTEREIESGEFLAIRWGLDNSSVLVLEIGATEPEVFGDIIEWPVNVHEITASTKGGYVVPRDGEPIVEGVASGGKETPTLTPEQVEQGFIPWSSGKRPVAPDRIVEVLFRLGMNPPQIDEAGCLSWEHYGTLADIVAYRLVGEPKKLEGNGKSNSDIFAPSGELKLSAKAKGWKLWGGGYEGFSVQPRPTGEGLIAVRYRDGTTSGACKPVAFDWYGKNLPHTPHPMEIVAYCPAENLDKPDPDPDPEWIEWKGGECPVPQNQVVEMKIRGGRTLRGAAKAFDWQHGDDDSVDIVAYRMAYGWIAREHGETKNPLPGKRVDVRFGDGMEHHDSPSDEFGWHYGDEGEEPDAGTIIAYRETKPLES